MELIVPCQDYRQSFLAAQLELEPEGNASALALRDFNRYLERLNEFSNGLNLAEGLVPESEFWLVDDGEFIGRICIRHSLNEFLKECGGHIGYMIRTSKRNMGYGTQILQLAIPRARDLGLDKVLITCDETNHPSRRIIESAGGRDPELGKVRDNGARTLKFWIDISE
jgi:predicted acetyltransferase